MVGSRRPKPGPGERRPRSWLRSPTGPALVPQQKMATRDVRRIEDALRKRLGTDVTSHVPGGVAADSSASATTPTTILRACSS